MCASGSSFGDAAFMAAVQAYEARVHAFRLRTYRMGYRVIFSTKHTQEAPSQGERVHGLMMNEVNGV
jgi:hypothetical protein